MKPEKGFDEMEEKQYDPREFFEEVGMLITEARLPELSMKGRVEGPHCPPVSGYTNSHACDRHKEQCRKARGIQSQQEVLWQNKIPMRIDVLLFPDCEHGYREETIVEGATFSTLDNFELLERWDIQTVKKRSPERIDGFVTGRIHLQAIRSYLHFSQLSSWLISHGGELPIRVIYRVYAPGEAVGYSFDRLPEVHNFPSADLGHVIMRTTVAHLPRQDRLVLLECRSPSPGVEQHLRTRKYTGEDRASPLTAASMYEPRPSTSKSDEEYDYKHFTQKKSHSKDQMEYGKGKQPASQKKPPIGQKSKDGTVTSQSKLRSDKCVPCPASHTPKRKVDQLSPTIQSMSNYASVNDNMNNSCPNNINRGHLSPKSVAMVTTKQSDIPSSSISVVKSVSSEHQQSKLSQILQTKSHPYKKPSCLTVSTTTTVPISKRLPSPKVLMTETKKPHPSAHKKRCLDLNAAESVCDSTDKIKAFKQLDDFSPSDINDLVKPLSPSDLEVYLSSLSSKGPRGKTGPAQLKNIPTTKCSFYLGDGETDQNDRLAQKSYKDVNDARVLSNLPPSTAQQSLSDISETSSDVVFPRSGKHVRALFRNSISTSEVDKDVSHDSRSVRKERASSETETYGIHSDKTNIQDPSAVCDISKICDDSDEIKTAENSPVSGENYAFREVEGSNDGECRSLTPPTSCDTNTLTIDANRGTHNLQREVTPNKSKRERTLNELSIPCKIGAVNTAMTSLVQNLESMDIDDNVPVITQKRASPLSHVSRSSPSLLDSEVEHHLTQTGGTVRDAGIGGRGQRGGDCDSEAGGQPRGLALCKQLLRKEFEQNVHNEILSGRQTAYKNLPSPDDIRNFHFMVGRSASAIFNSSTGLPSRSSPAPLKKKASNRFDYDCSLTNVRAIKNAISCSKLTLQSEDNSDTIEDPKIISTSAPASTNCLLGNFEESVLNGRIEPVGVVDGFTVEIGAGGTFCPKHVMLPVAAYFFQLSDDNAPSPYLGHVNLEPLGKRGYHIPRTGTVQVTLFNPNKTVVKMFVVMYDLSDMPANCQTFLRQRTVYMPADDSSSDPSYLRYLIHLRFSSSKSGKIYLHTDLRLIFARDKFEFDPRVANYELRSFTEGPENPKFSPKR